MTWKEFKEEVDRQLKEQDISEDTRIRLIDVSDIDDIKAFLDVNEIDIV